MRNTNMRNRRGSILLLVIGLLTILAMLGATFLFIARLDSRQSKALAQTSQSDNLASGIVKTVSKLLKDDLLYDPNPAIPNDEIPYGTDSGTPQIRNYIDCPGNENYLSSIAYSTYQEGTPTPADVYRWNFLTNIHGETVTGKYEFVNLANMGPSTKEYVSVGGGLNDPDYIILYSATITDDTDPRIVDSMLYDTGTTTSAGEKLYAGVRVIDLGGLLCVNTAGKDDATVNVKTPVRLNLEGLLGTNSYNLVNGSSADATNPGRCPTNTTPEEDYYINCGKQPFSPAISGYLPYAIGDESFLRNLTPIKNNPSTAQGRLAGILQDNTGGLSQAYLNCWRGFMTTFNCSRQVVRYPATNLKNPLYIGDTTDIEDVNKRNALVQALNTSGFPAQESAQFVANLWASMTDSLTAQNKSFKVEYPAAAPTTTAYGLILQPVITEAFVLNRYATAVEEADDGDEDTTEDWISDNNAAWACAIELMNPSTTQDINLVNYRLLIEYKDSGGLDTTSTIDLSVYGTLPHSAGIAGDNKLVIYNIKNSDNAITTGNDIKDSDFGDTSSWNSDSNLTFLNPDGSTDVTVTLFRRIGTDDILLDKITTSDLGCIKSELDLDPNPRAEATIPDEIKDIRRDDVIANGHYAVPEYVSNTTHQLLQDNGVTLAAGISIPFDLNGIKHGIPESVGELSDIYLVGPSDTKTTTESFDGKKLETLTRAKTNWISTAINSSNSYPNVPYACILSEYFTRLSSDTTRTDEPRRVYGKVNINSAPKTVLAALPWPILVDLNGNGIVDTGDIYEPSKIAEYIIAYRDGLSVNKSTATVSWTTGVNDTRVYGDKDAIAPDRFTRTTASEVTNLRTPEIDDVIGFLTPAELAIPLWNYTIDALGHSDAAAFQADPDYFVLYDKLYRAVSNLVTVNSDVYAVNIRVQVGNDPNEQNRVWYYVAVIDRSNCRTAADEPQVLLFTQVK